MPHFHSSWIASSKLFPLLARVVFVYRSKHVVLKPEVKPFID